MHYFSPDALTGQRAVPRGTARARGSAGRRTQGGREGAGRSGGGGRAERARRVNGKYIAKARTLDHEHSRQADGTRYPGVREQVQRHLVGPVLAALRAWDPVLARPGGGLVLGRAAVEPWLDTSTLDPDTTRHYPDTPTLRHQCQPTLGPTLQHQCQASVKPS